MKNYKITEKQVKELAKGNKKVEQMFPEVFETKLEIGKWYHYNGWLICFTGIKNDTYKVELLQGYGFDKEMKFREIGNFRSSSAYWVLATEEEVKSSLIKEAERRGFRYGLNFKELEHKRNSGLIRNSGKIGSNWDFSENTLFSVGFGRWAVFKDGVWAEVIKEEVTLNFQQIADKFGIDVEQLRITKL